MTHAFKLLRAGLAGSCALLAMACGGDDDPCDPAANSGCDDGLVCEAVQDGDPACFAPVVISGRAFDLLDAGAVAGARVVAVAANGAPAGSVAVSAADGAYVIRVPALRDADGTPVAGTDVTLRADAAAYASFPGAVRPALPIDTRTPVEEDGRWVVRTAATDVGLLPLPSAPTGSIHGVATMDDGRTPALVVVESDALGAVKGRSAIADRDGDYRIFNLPPGSYTVTAYAAGHSYQQATVTLAAGQDLAADLALDDAPTSTFAGQVQLVNPQAGDATSVILVVESTFDPALLRGDSPPGLRAPGPGGAPTVTGPFTIEGVPAGRYVVLAGFENDHLVRDTSSIGGTDIVHQAIVAGQDVTIDASFKVTGAVDLVSPGAAGPEVVTGTPTFRWVDDTSEDRYQVTVIDAYGNQVWTHEELAGPHDPSTVYAGPALTAGMTYQFRVVSIKDPAEVLSYSEDLRGVFTIAR
jgi:hypothetical protein